MENTTEKREILDSATCHLRFKANNGRDYPTKKAGKLGDIAIRVSRKAPATSKAPIMMISAASGYIYQSDRYAKDNTGTSLKNYTLLKRGELSYNHGYSKLRNYGSCFTLCEEDEARIPNVYHSFSILDNDPYYFGIYLNCGLFDKELKKAVSSTARMDGLLNIAFDDYMALPINIPCIEEQKKIVAFFSAYDEKIALQKDQVETLEKRKKGLLQKIFSQELRFKADDGNEYPEWSNGQILDLLMQPITDGPHETPILVSHGIPFISADAIKEGRIDFSRKRGYITEKYNEECGKKYSPQPLDVYMIKSGSTTGETAIVTTKEPFNIWSPLAALRCGKKSVPYFLYSLLQSSGIQTQVKNKCSHGTQPNLSMRQLEMFSVKIPSIEEQKKIADFFVSVDTQIYLAKDKLETMKEIKKGLLQQMFC